MPSKIYLLYTRSKIYIYACNSNVCDIFLILYNVGVHIILDTLLSLIFIYLIMSFYVFPFTYYFLLQKYIKMQFYIYLHPYLK